LKIFLQKCFISVKHGAPAKVENKASPTIPKNKCFWVLSIQGSFIFQKIATNKPFNMAFDPEKACMIE
jgi:hypothetical protein